MTQQPAGEWDEMSQQTRDEIKARLHDVIENAERAEYRGRIVRASRPSPRATEAMRHHGI